jgi:hypothetical protein
MFVQYVEVARAWGSHGSETAALVLGAPGGSPSFYVCVGVVHIGRLITAFPSRAPRTPRAIGVDIVLNQVGRRLTQEDAG